MGNSHQKFCWGGFCRYVCLVTNNLCKPAPFVDQPQLINNLCKPTPFLDQPQKPGFFEGFSVKSNSTRGGFI
ncbi:hypothetical protein WN50_38825 [Limnoraphis robusta CS-951]|uniref:Uncharacterized protein n=1 Tax=Limnoraphis robusta CS-951 TaxID=1637645 RepID=A0A0J9EXV5_9CYAN|nr:hypothetical protein WN50_38825 [Limnoraphis robusta CS-951]